MKTNKHTTLTVSVFCLNMPSHAQFNTIGTINNKHINTTNPPKSHETLTDSTIGAGSVVESKATDIEDNCQTLDFPFDNQDLMSLVALPLKNI